MKFVKMLRFFQKIRKDKIFFNQFNRYTIYAVGEIILVVIGILIALQINNLNEKRKAQKLAKDYSQTIITELESNIGEYNRFIRSFQNRLKKFDAFYETINNPNVSEDEIIAATDSVVTFVGIASTNSEVIAELIISGNLEVFPKDVRTYILEYLNNREFDLDLLNAQIEDVKWYKRRFFAEIDLAFEEEAINSESSISKGWKTSRNSKAFLNSTNFYSVRYDMLQTADFLFDRAIEETEDLIEILSEFL